MSLFRLWESLRVDRQFLLRFAYLPAGLLRLAVLAGVTLHICILMFADFTNSQERGHLFCLFSRRRAFWQWGFVVVLFLGQGFPV